MEPFTTKKPNYSFAPYDIIRIFEIISLLMFLNDFRGGRPILICEEGDEETRQLSPGTCIEIPHTVDCLQVSSFAILL